MLNLIVELFISAKSRKMGQKKEATRLSNCYLVIVRVQHDDVKWKERQTSSLCWSLVATETHAWFTELLLPPCQSPGAMTCVGISKSCCWESVGKMSIQDFTDRERNWSASTSEEVQDPEASPLANEKGISFPHLDRGPEFFNCELLRGLS